MFEGQGENWEEDASKNGFIGEREEGYTGNPNTVNLRMYARPDQVDDAKSYLLKILSVGKPDNLHDGLEGCEMCDLYIADENGNEVPFEEFFKDEIEETGYEMNF